MSNTYWNTQGKYQAEYDQLFATLVPSEGKCDTVAGELIRAITKVYYDGCNNGFCNNTSGPVKFIIRTLPANNPVISQLNALYEVCNTYTHHSVMQHYYDCLELIMNYVIEYAPELVNEENHIDMWDLDDPEYQDEDDDFYDEEEYDDE